MRLADSVNIRFSECTVLVETIQSACNFFSLCPSVLKYPAFFRIFFHTTFLMTSVDGINGNIETASTQYKTKKECKCSGISISR